MTDSDVDASVDGSAPPVPASAGALLRAAREASGMTIDAVAQQLKLAPRQVRAIEEGDFTHLPGRTFVRGFIRNYARLVRLDAETVLGALPAGTASPNLDSPPLHATAPTIGELPTTEVPRHGWTRWAIPLTLIAIIAAAAAWELLHPAPDAPRGGARKDAPPTVERATTGAPEVIGTPLPNPIAASPPPAAAPAATPEKMPAAVPATEVVASKAAPESAPAPRPPGGPAVADAPLVLAFRDFSWTEVKDRSGRVLISRMNSGGTTQAVAGAPPLDLVIGNASDVTLTWKGKRVDLAPHTRQNVARFTLE
ncbi:MAG: RodZ domain-containing protein [Casimicrobiaceae bacterium]